MCMIAPGKTVAKIADKLYLSENTIPDIRYRSCSNNHTFTIQLLNFEYINRTCPLNKESTHREYYHC
jgi:hypothetical protein